ncbi:MAG: WD40 repeat domain-containing protein [Anaerolineae bacterium]|nr:WD40 repeat domain-containing protein [Anaerolineae bacterium]
MAGAVIKTFVICLMALSISMQNDDGSSLPPLEPITPENVAKLELLATLEPEQGEFHELAWLPPPDDGADRKILAIIGLNPNGIWLYDVSDFEIEPRFWAYSDPIEYLAFSPDGSILATSTIALGSYPPNSHPIIQLRSVETGEEVATLDPQNDNIDSLAFSTNGTLLVSGGSSLLDMKDALIWIWDVKERQLLTILDAHASYVGGIAFHPTKPILATGGFHEIWLWDMETYEPIRSLGEFSYFPVCLAFSPDGSVLASGGGHGDATLQLWNVATGRQIAAGEAANWDVRNLAFNPAGTVLAAGTQWSAVQLWDVAAGEILIELTPGADSVNSVAFSADGSLLATGHQDYKVRLWGVPVNE